MGGGGDDSTGQHHQRKKEDWSSLDDKMQDLRFPMGGGRSWGGGHGGAGERGQGDHGSSAAKSQIPFLKQLRQANDQQERGIGSVSAPRFGEQASSSPSSAREAQFPMPSVSVNLPRAGPSSVSRPAPHSSTAAFGGPSAVEKFVGTAEIRSPAPSSPRPASPQLKAKQLPHPPPKPLLGRGPVEGMQGGPKQSTTEGIKEDNRNLLTQSVALDPPQQPSSRPARTVRQWEPSSSATVGGMKDPPASAPAGDTKTGATKNPSRFHVPEPRTLSTTSTPHLISPQGAAKSLMMTAAISPQRPIVTGSAPTSGLVCFECLQPVGKTTLTALGRPYHPGCFRCTRCRTGLEHVSFLEQEGKPYCHLDYHELFSKRCAQCGTPIEDEMIRAPVPSTDGGKAEYKSYHPLHFFCAGCGNPFAEPTPQSNNPFGSTGTRGSAGGKFIWRDGYPFCKDCNVKRFATRCQRPGCTRGPGGSNVIPDGTVIVKAMNGTFHESCFVCKGCGTRFQDGFIVNRGEPWHETCLRSRRLNET